MWPFWLAFCIFAIQGLCGLLALALNLPQTQMSEAALRWSRMVSFLFGGFVAAALLLWGRS